ncbi:TonB-dependent receptor [Rufibacter latericius]|uniref:TonB-dependent receptor n=1 Tax=Rufibacter latericius TaxID=2487040 RepID=A0A3M9N104_9BACT|nr:carboxypeptidase regulatory-like domain-containing protein [Rufibacter latericius]RNI31450.1 TonB-dependent receptor [Rufibacter latericius]
MKKLSTLLLLILLLCLSTSLSWGQGATTASMTGEITDAGGVGLPGATIVAVHTPSNTQYAASANENGRFNLQNMRVGGPYTITATYIGYQDQRRENVFLSLGQTLRLDINLAASAVGLSEVQVVSERGAVINADRTGAATNVSREQIERLPTLNRSLQDFTRLTPQASGNSLGGANNRYNNITIDGAVNNDVFGIGSTGTPGGQAGTQPISLDAIDQIQVVLAPYDVKFGNFTGGGINAVTRSGTNNWEGSAYAFGRNEKTVGEDPVTEQETAEFKDYQTGFRVGGPIFKDKLFFFLNGEITRRTEPLLFNLGDPGNIVPAEDVRRIADTLRIRYGYDPGTLGPINRLTESNKLFGRLDWNITDRHQLTLRHNFVDAFDENITRTNTTFRFGGNAYRFNSKTNSTVAELRSRFSESLSNSLIVGYSRIREERDTPGGLFPQVTIRFAGSGSNTITAGTERSSAFNELDQDIFEFTDNLTIFRGRHTITLGTHNEFFDFRNLFINNYNGYYQFNSAEDFYAGRPFQIEQTYSASANNPTPAAEFNAMQLGFYVQDEMDVLPNLRVTLGLRVDVPIIPDEPARNLGVETAFENYPAYTNLRTDVTPSGQVLWAPRLGFNWDVRGDKTIQVRGGTGIFTGRVPFVWLSNQFVNNGITFNSLQLRNQTAPNQFITNIDQIRTLGAASSSTEINLITDDFKIPQTFRTNLAVDFTLPLGIIATLEGIYSKTMNDIVYRDINLLDPTGNLTGPDQRPLYSSGRVSSAFTNVILLDNTNRGYTYTITGQLQKNFNNGINTMVAYTYGRSEDVNSGTSSTARSNWQFNQVYWNPNDPELSFSRFDIRHRVIASGGYSIKWLNNFATSVSLFYEGQSGLPFTYLYAGDVNNDGSNANDLLYVPRTFEESGLIDLTSSGVVTRTAAQQWTDLNAYIENDDYLKSRRGQYAERHGARTPWTHRVDLRLAQDIFHNFGGKNHTLQLTFDVFNIGNLFNADWGRNYSVNNSAVELVRFQRRDENNRPLFTFSNPSTSVWTTTFSSRWQGQAGIRYIFQ